MSAPDRIAVDPGPNVDPGAVTAAIAALEKGEPVLLIDTGEDTATGYLTLAAQDADAENVTFLVRRGSGVIAAAMPRKRAELLDLHAPGGSAAAGGALGMPIDHREASPAPSTAGRARTLQGLADPEAGAADFLRPGHVLPLPASEGRLPEQAAPRDAAVELVRWSGRQPVAAMTIVADDNGVELSQHGQLLEFAAVHGLPAVMVEAVVRHQLRHELLVGRAAETRLTTRHGDFRCIAWTSEIDGCAHIALVMGDLSVGGPPLVRVHSECRSGDVFASQLCPCRRNLEQALSLVAEERRGAVVYLRGPDGAGISRTHDLFSGPGPHPEVEDDRAFAVGAQILRELGVREMRLLTDDPNPLPAAADYGLRIVERVMLGEPRPQAKRRSG